jgi:flagellar export protein FliJ
VQRFEFSLDRVLKVKRQLEALAEREQHRARLAADAAHARAAALRQRLAEVAEAMADRIGQATAPHQWLAAFETSERLGEAITAADRHADECDARLHAAARERAQVAGEVQALDTLRQQQFDTWRRTYQQAEQDAADEITVQRWSATRAAHSGAA